MTDNNGPVASNPVHQNAANEYTQKRPIRTARDLAGIAGPLPEGMTAVDLCREARQIGSASRWERYLAQLAEEAAAREP